MKDVSCAKGNAYTLVLNREASLYQPEEGLPDL